MCLQKSKNESASKLDGVLQALGSWDLEETEETRPTERSLSGSVLSEEGLRSARAETGDASYLQGSPVQAVDAVAVAGGGAIAVAAGVVAAALAGLRKLPGLPLASLAAIVFGPAIGIAMRPRMHEVRDADERSRAEPPIGQVGWRESLDKLKDCRAKAKILDWTNKYAGLLSRIRALA